jgi:diaminohydroxyphosphoribosylaminopyrimidine deaminase / 5-amino-6-(5-phosphoribosylamino)uracil reductase
MRGDDDAKWMQRALALARRGEGLTRPNPPVGAVVVRGGVVVGEGYHRKAGEPHAEIHALDKAAARSRGSTLYVTLEPCSTWGRTPPCTDAILKAGLRRVVIAAEDPNPDHRGRGADLLRRAGLAVQEGVCGDEAEQLIAPFAKWVTSGRPFLTLKLAMSLDGKIADARGRSRWITGEASRRIVHDLRRRSDAIMVGSGTVRVDNPSLLPRPDGRRAPFRVVVDSRGSAPATARVFTDDHCRQTVFATTRACPSARLRALARKGIAVLVLPPRAGRVSLPSLLRRLGGLGLLHVVCEGGGALAGALARASLVDRYLLFYGPRLIGRGVDAMGGEGWRLPSAPRLRVESVMRIGADVLVTANAIVEDSLIGKPPLRA